MLIIFKKQKVFANKWNRRHSLHICLQGNILIRWEYLSTRKYPFLTSMYMIISLHQFPWSSVYINFHDHQSTLRISIVSYYTIDCLGNRTFKPERISLVCLSATGCTFANSSDSELIRLERGSVRCVWQIWRAEKDSKSRTLKNKIK